MEKLWVKKDMIWLLAKIMMRTIITQYQWIKPKGWPTTLVTTFDLCVHGNCHNLKGVLTMYRVTNKTSTIFSTQGDNFHNLQDGLHSFHNINRVFTIINTMYRINRVLLYYFQDAFKAFSIFVNVNIVHSCRGGGGGVYKAGATWISIYIFRRHWDHCLQQNI